MRIFLLILTLYAIACMRIDAPGILVPETVEQDERLPHIEIEVANVIRKIHLRTFGVKENPALFMLHGTYSDSKSLRELAINLSTDFFVVLWDQRGMGLSERIERDEFSLDASIKEIEQIKKVLGIEYPIHLLGHSWGAGIATLFAATYPLQVNSLVLIEPMPLTGDVMQAVYPQIIDFKYWNGSWNNQARQQQAMSAKDHQRLDYRAAMTLQSSVTKAYHCNPKKAPIWPVHRVGGAVEYYRNKLLMPEGGKFRYDFTKGIEAYENPTLILGGTCSPLNAQKHQVYSAQYFNRLQLRDIPQAGHRVIIERPKEVEQSLRSFWGLQ